MIVADANLVAALCLNTERTSLAQLVRRTDASWIVPPLFRAEILSVIGKYLRVALLMRDQGLRTPRRAEALVAVVDDADRPRQVLTLMQGSKCSSYDLEYVAVARRYGIPLVTADRQVLQEFTGTAWSFEEFVQRQI